MGVFLWMLTSVAGVKRHRGRELTCGYELMCFYSCVLMDVDQHCGCIEAQRKYGDVWLRIDVLL